MPISIAYRKYLKSKEGVLIRHNMTSGKIIDNNPAEILENKLY
jgi:hypothetical protein